MSKNSITTPSSLRGDVFSQVNMLEFLRPLHEKNKNAGFGVCQFAHGVTAANGAYLSGVYSPAQNRIYFIPLLQAPLATWHYLDCSTGAVVAYTHGFGTTLPSQAFSGGTYSPTQNRIYFTPYAISTSPNWYYIDCNTGAVVAYAHGASVSANGYLGGTYSPKQNRIYFVPYGQASTSATWHYLDCNTGLVVGYSALVINSSYYGGVYSPTQNRIYFVPFGIGPTANWQYINCDTGAVVTYAHGFGTTIPSQAYTGGVYSPTQNRIYFIPRNARIITSWHYVDCDTGAIVAYAYGVSIPDTYGGGCYSPLSNRIYMCPIGISSYATWHYIDCNTGAVVPYEHGVTAVVNAYAGNAVYSPTQNRMYFTPYAQAAQTLWHYVQEYSASENTTALMSNGIFNKL